MSAPIAPTDDGKSAGKEREPGPRAARKAPPPVPEQLDPAPIRASDAVLDVLEDPVKSIPSLIQALPSAPTDAKTVIDLRAETLDVMSRVIRQMGNKVILQADWQTMFGGAGEEMVRAMSEFFQANAQREVSAGEVLAVIEDQMQFDKYAHQLHEMYVAKNFVPKNATIEEVMVQAKKDALETLTFFLQGEILQGQLMDETLKVVKTKTKIIALRASQDIIIQAEQDYIKAIRSAEQGARVLEITGMGEMEHALLKVRLGTRFGGAFLAGVTGGTAVEFVKVFQDAVPEMSPASGVYAIAAGTGALMGAGLGAAAAYFGAAEFVPAVFVGALSTGAAFTVLGMGASILMASIKPELIMTFDRRLERAMEKQALASARADDTPRAVKIIDSK